MRTAPPRAANARDAQAPVQRSLFDRPILRWLALGVAVLVLATAAGFLYLSGDPNEVSVDRALEDFRASAPTTEPTDPTQATARPAPGAQPAAGPAAANAPAQTAQPAQNGAPAPAKTTGFTPPAVGVYVYATKGYESTDALGGARHDYPSETSYTIKKGGCGWIGRWQPLEERWDETEMCERPEGTENARYTMYHEFFRRGQEEVFKCDGFVQKPNAKPGDTWTFNCRSSNSTANSKVTFVRFENVTVEGKAVRTMRMRYDVTASGANRGRILQERWLAITPRAMVRMTQVADLVVASPFGPVNYDESFRLDLKSFKSRT